MNEAAKLRALPCAYDQIEVVVEDRPQSGPGRPSRQQLRPVQVRRYGLKPTLRARSAVIPRKRQEAACFVLLTTVPTTGERAHSAKEVLGVSKTQHGVEQNCAFLKDPLIVNSLFLKKPERIEALGLVLDHKESL